MQIPDDMLIMFGLMSDKPIHIIRCSFCGTGLVMIGKRDDVQLNTPRINCWACGVENQWHLCFTGDTAREYIANEAAVMDNTSLLEVALGTQQLRNMIRIAESKGWRDISQKQDANP